MAKYYISHNDYFGFCVIEEIDGTGKIVFAGSIEDCNRKCIELNNTLWAETLFGASAGGWSPGSDDGRPKKI